MFFHSFINLDILEANDIFYFLLIKNPDGDAKGI